MDEEMRMGKILYGPKGGRLYEVEYANRTHVKQVRQIIADRMEEDCGIKFYTGKRLVAAFRDWVWAGEAP